VTWRSLATRRTSKARVAGIVTLCRTELAVDFAASPSRAALNRLLDPENDSVTLTTLRKAGIVVGREIRLELVDLLTSHLSAGYVSFLHRGFELPRESTLDAGGRYFLIDALFTQPTIER
jgi:hypothetical protein